MTERRPLDIVHFSTADREGGSGRSAWRIHRGLRARGHRSRMLVGYATETDPEIDTVAGGAALRLIDRVTDMATARLGFQYWAFPSEARLRRHPWLAGDGPDIVQLFNTHGGYLSPRSLPWLARRASVVWRLSDMWPVTGHCAYAGPCERWRTGCGACPDLATYPKIGIDRTAQLWRRKAELYRRTRPTIVAPSSWTERIARESPLFAEAAVHRIPNGVDTALFRPIARDAARAVLGIPAHGKGILFAAHVAFDNPRKGTRELENALRFLKTPEDTLLLVAGIGAEAWRGRVPQTVVPLGYLRDDRLLAAACAAADVVAVPSVSENLPNGLIEALACGLPAVAFDAGGIRDAVIHEETGLLVPPGDVASFARGLERMLTDDGLRARLAARARGLAESEFDAAVEASRFEILYRTLRQAATPTPATGFTR